MCHNIAPFVFIARSFTLAHEHKHIIYKLLCARAVKYNLHRINYDLLQSMLMHCMSDVKVQAHDYLSRG